MINAQKLPNQNYQEAFVYMMQCVNMYCHESEHSADFE